jgi:hypothetical protein
MPKGGISTSGVISTSTDIKASRVTYVYDSYSSSNSDFTNTQYRLNVNSTRYCFIIVSAQVSVTTNQRVYCGVQIYRNDDTTTGLYGGIIVPGSTKSQFITKIFHSKLEKGEGVRFVLGADELISSGFVNGSVTLIQL